MDAVVGHADLPPDVLQPRACLVADLLLADDAALDLGGQVCEGFKGVKIDVQAVGQLFCRLVAAVGFCPACGLQDLADPQELPGAQDAPDLQPFQGVADGIAAGKGKAAFFYDP